eukprot:COSAG01_NODE_3697_length_5784_cov_5.993492_5_plen_107_part_01
MPLHNVPSFPVPGPGIPGPGMGVNPLSQPVGFVSGISSGIASADGGLLPIDSNNPFWDDSDQQFDTDNLFASNGSLSFGSSSFGSLSLPDALSLPGPGAAVVPPPAP